MTLHEGEVKQTATYNRKLQRVTNEVGGLHNKQGGGRCKPRSPMSESNIVGPLGRRRLPAFAAQFSDVGPDGRHSGRRELLKLSIQFFDTQADIGLSVTKLDRQCQ